MVLLRPYLLMYDSQPTKLVPEDMNINLFSDEIAAGSLIKSHYFGLLPISFAPDRFIHVRDLVLSSYKCYFFNNYSLIAIIYLSVLLMKWLNKPLNTYQFIITNLLMKEN